MPQAPRTLPLPPLAAGLVLLLAGPLAGQLAPAQVGLVSTRDTSRYTASYGSSNPTMSADGRYVVFESISTDLVSGLTGPMSDNVYLYDRIAGTTTLVSHAAGDPTARGDNYSSQPVVSADGNFVVFHSVATDLVPGYIRRQTFGGSGDLFLYERASGQVTLITSSKVVAGGGGDDDSANPTVSADGRFVAFHSLSSDLVSGQAEAARSSDVFLYDRTTATTLLLSHPSGAPATASGNSYFPQVSADGNFVAFESGATNIVSGVTDTNNDFDIFLYDRAAGTTTLLSHGASPLQAGNGGCYGPLISADGSFSAWNSLATNLVPGQVDGNGGYDVFLYDRQAGTTALVSHIAGNPLQAPAQQSIVGALSPDGRYVGWSSGGLNLVPGQVDANGTSDAFLYDRLSGTSVLVGHASGATTTTANDSSNVVAISADDRFLLLLSQATDVVPSQVDTAGTRDLFLYDIGAGSTVLLSRLGGSAATAVGGLFIPASISADGRYVAFQSQGASGAAGIDAAVLDRNNMIDVFLYDRVADASTALTVALVTSTSATPTGSSSPVAGAMSADGRFLVFRSDAPDVVPGVRDINHSDDLFLYDRTTGTKTLLSHVIGSLDPSQFGGSDEAAISADGRYVAFSSSGLIEPGQGVIGGNVFLYDRLTEQTTLVSHAVGVPDQVANSGSENPAISADGRYVAFVSSATDLIAGFQLGSSPAVYLYDRVTGTTTLVSHHDGNALRSGNGPSGRAVLSADGRYIAYGSTANDLAPGQIDTNGLSDVFLYDRTTGISTLVSQSGGSAISGDDPAISADGRYVAYVKGDGSVLLYDRMSGTTILAGSNAPVLDTPSLSADGRFVAFASLATALVPGQVDGNGSYDVFLYDRVLGTTTLVSRSTAGATTTGNQGAVGPVLSADGGTVAFISAATDLVAGQDPGSTATNVFLYDRGTGRIALASTNGTGSAHGGNGNSASPLLSADGGWVAFGSSASDLAPNDTNSQSDVFLFGSPFTGRAFFTLPPCRLLDTRQPGQGPALLSGSQRTLPVHGACGVPASARAIVANVTITQPTAAGFLSAFPADTGMPATSTLNFGPGQTRSNNAVLPLSLDGAGLLALGPFVAGNGTVHVIVDVNGYFE
jgi:Tol biopolymer transport system component